MQRRGSRVVASSHIALQTLRKRGFRAGRDAVPYGPARYTWSDTWHLDRANGSKIAWILAGMSTRREGRTVDGGGLENLIDAFSEFAIFPLNSARRVRSGTMIQPR